MLAGPTHPRRTLSVAGPTPPRPTARSRSVDSAPPPRVRHNDSVEIFIELKEDNVLRHADEI